MDINKTNIDELNAVLRVKILKEDYEDRVNSILKDYRKKANLDGFRPGKVPFGLINKMYRKPVLMEEINKIIGESVSKYIVDEKLKILGDPLPNEKETHQINWDNDKEFEFVFDLGLIPEFDLNISKKDKIPVYKIKTDNKIIQKFIDNYTARFGNYIPAEKITDKETVRANIVQLNEQNEPLEEGIVARDVSIAVSIIKDEAIKKRFGGLTTGSTIEIDLKKAFPSDIELINLLNIKKEEVKNIKGNFRISIEEITRYEKAEVNQDLFNKIYGEGKVQSEDEFKEKIIEEANIALEQDSDYKFRIDVKDYYVSKFNKDLPEEFLKRWLIAVNKDKYTKEQIEKDFEHFTKDLKWQLIRNKIAEQFGVKVTEEEVLEEAKILTKMQFRQYGISNVPEDHIESYAKKLMEKEEEKKRLYEKKYEDKVIMIVKENVKADIKEVSEEKFSKLLEKNNTLA